ncbi:hypothetical protein [Streptomyces atroolivaceus]|uniref:hypothetical protein n=1 Tax=Streptomyces atroolivaceus TaxID=66869 RepID=UPI0037A45460
MWKWRLTAVGMNLLLGVPGLVPVWLLWYYVSNGPLAELGWTSREANENDGMLLWLVIVVPVVVVSAVIWRLVNEPVRRRAALAPRAYWTAGALLTLVPTGVLVVGSV